MRSTVDLAHHLGLWVVAEGVEDQATLEGLRLIGCDTAQGYHLSRPMPAREFERWFSARPQPADPSNRGSRTCRPHFAYETA